MVRIPDFKNPSDSEKIIAILREKNPILASGGLPRVKGHYSSNVIEKIDPDTKLEFENYRCELEALPSNKLHDLWLVVQEKERKKHLASLPFNQPGTDARFEYWSKAAYWTVDEMAALSIGKDPHWVNANTFSSHQVSSPLARRYVENRDLIERAIKFKSLYTQTMPGIFINWAKPLNIELPEELINQVSENTPDLTDYKTLYDHALEIARENKEIVQAQNQSLEVLATEKEQLISRAETAEEAYQNLQQEIKDQNQAPTSGQTRTMNSLMKLVAAMAYQKYGWRPGKPGKMPGPAKQIAGATDDIGASISENTIRKHLNDSLELIEIPPDK